MKTLYLLMMRAFLVAFASDVAVKIQGEVNHLDLTNINLRRLHMCLCNTSHMSCIFNVIKEEVTSTRSAVPQANSSTEYLNAYMCTLHTVAINCTRRSQNSEEESTILHKAKSFSLHDNETCDINCVDVFWDDTVRNITIKTDKISGELCASSSQDVISTTHIIIIAVVSCVVVAVVIAVITAAYVRAKRQRQHQNTARCGDDSETCKHPEEEKLPGQEPQHLYCEIEKDEPDPQETHGNSQPRNKNAYSKLRVKPEKVVNTYNELLLSNAEVQPPKPPRLYK